MQQLDTEALSTFLLDRIAEQEQRCRSALNRADLSIDVHLALTVALNSCELERITVNRWRHAMRTAHHDSEAGRVAAALEVLVLATARLYRHHPSYEFRWAG